VGVGIRRGFQGAEKEEILEPKKRGKEWENERKEEKGAGLAGWKQEREWIREIYR